MGLSLQFLHGENLVILQKMEGVHKLFQIPDLGLLAPGFGIAHIVILDQIIGQIRLLGFCQFFFHSSDPFHQGFELLFDAGNQAVGGLDPAIQVALLCADASLFHLLHQRAFMHRGDLLDALGFIATVVDPDGDAFSLKFRVHHQAPGFPPMLQRFRLMPIGGVNGVEYILTLFIPDALTVFIQGIFPALFVTPGAIRIEGPHGGHHMEVRIGDAVLLVRLMHGKIGNHPFAHEMLLHETSGQGGVLLMRQFVLQGNIKAVGQLRLLVFLHLLHSVP